LRGCSGWLEVEKWSRHMKMKNRRANREKKKNKERKAETKNEGRSRPRNKRSPGGRSGRGDVLGSRGAPAGAVERLDRSGE
jgi:hypothetical protein